MATVFYRGFYRKIENLRLQCAWSGEVTGKNSKILVGFRSLLAIWLDKGWGNPDRNVVAQTICCWWTCGFAWWLIHFFDEEKDSAAWNSFVCFGASISCHASWQKQNEECELFRRVQRFWQRKVWTQRHSRREKLRCKFLARKSAKLFANTKVQIFGKERCKTHR